MVEHSRLNITACAENSESDGYNAVYSHVACNHELRDKALPIPQVQWHICWTVTYKYSIFIGSYTSNVPSEDS